MAKKIFMAACAALFGLAAAFADLGPRHIEREGGFSIYPPAGWQVQEFSDLAFKIFTGPAADGFAPNVNFIDEDFDGGLKDYVDASLKMIEAAVDSFKLLQRKVFTAKTGLRGEIVVTQTAQQGYNLRQTFFFFADRGGRKIVATCSTLAADGAKYDKVFEESFATFEILK